MEYQKLSKDNFLDEVYILTCKSKDDFQKYANQNLESVDAMIFVEAAIINGQLFMTNQTCLALAELTNENETTYFIDSRGAYGFCPSTQYEYIKEQIITDDLDDDIELDKEFRTPIDNDVNRIYG